MELNVCLIYLPVTHFQERMVTYSLDILGHEKFAIKIIPGADQFPGHRATTCVIRKCCHLNTLHEDRCKLDSSQLNTD